MESEKRGNSLGRKAVGVLLLVVGAIGMFVSISDMINSARTQFEKRYEDSATYVEETTQNGSVVGRRKVTGERLNVEAEAKSSATESLRLLFCLGVTVAGLIQSGLGGVLGAVFVRFWPVRDLGDKPILGLDSGDKREPPQ